MVLGQLSSINLTLALFISNDFQATNYKPHLELRIRFSELSQHSIKDLKFCLHTNWLVILIHNTCKDMFELNYPYILGSMNLEYMLKDSFKEWCIVVQQECYVKLRLEVVPNSMTDDVLSVFFTQEHLSSKQLVAFSRALIISKLSASDVPRFIWLFSFEYFEQILLLVVIHAWLISKFDKEIDVGCSSQM